MLALRPPKDTARRLLRAPTTRPSGARQVRPLLTHLTRCRLSQRGRQRVRTSGSPGLSGRRVNATNVPPQDCVPASSIRGCGWKGRGSPPRRVRRAGPCAWFGCNGRARNLAGHHMPHETSQESPSTLPDGQQATVPQRCERGKGLPGPGPVGFSLGYGAGQARQGRPIPGEDGRGERRGGKVEPSPALCHLPWAASNDGTGAKAPRCGESQTLVG